MNYEQAKDIMDQHRAAVESSHGAVKANASPIKRNLENKTTLNFVDAKLTATGAPEYELKLFGNPILVFHREAFVINDQGWYSRTTHERLNQYMPRGFSIYSHRVQYLNKPNTVSFVKTPLGTYPYNMPTTLSYAGAGFNWYTDKASAAVAALPDYVEEYLNRLLHCLPCDNDVNTDAIYSIREPDPMKHSRALANCVVDNFHFSDLAQLAVNEWGKSLCYGGLELSEIVEVLISEGSTPFRNPRTINQLAQRTENSLKFNRPMPSIPSAWIKSNLRPILYEYIIDSLGFARAEWNRR